MTSATQTAPNTRTPPVPGQASPTPIDSPAGSQSHRTSSFAAFVESTKPGITRLVTITSIVGFAMSFLVSGTAISGRVFLLLLSSAVGTALCAGGANAINQYMERDRDARMLRTKGRPIPTGRLSPRAALLFGTGLTFLGLAVLLVSCGEIPMAVAAACSLSYILIYTPLKPVSALCTYVGTIPGALPPLIGWTALSVPGIDALDVLRHPGGWSLVVLMAVWQLPHSFALSWMYKEDYSRGGYKLLPVIDASGKLTAGTILVWSVIQIPATLWPLLTMPTATGWAYGAVATVCGLYFIKLCAAVWKSRNIADARRVFLVSIAVLPLLLTVMVIEGAIRRLL